MSLPTLHLGIEEIKKPTFAVHLPAGKFTTQVHLHTRHQLLYAEGGVLRFFTADQQFILPARHAAWIPAGLNHQVTSPSSQLYLRTLYIRAEDTVTMLPDRLLVFPVSTLAREMILYTQRWSIESAVTKTEEAFWGALISLIPDWCRAEIGFVLSTTEHQLLKAITTYLLQNLESELTLKDTGQAFGVSARTLMRLFRDNLDMTFGEYLRTARIIAAIELLSATDMPITEIALQVGYQSMGSFSQTFKAIVGQPPSVYRNVVRG